MQKQKHPYINKSALNKIVIFVVVLLALASINYLAFLAESVVDVAGACSVLAGSVLASALAGSAVAVALLALSFTAGVAVAVVVLALSVVAVVVAGSVVGVVSSVLVSPHAANKPNAIAKIDTFNTFFIFLLFLKFNINTANKKR
jgi:hypothetical protein